MTDPLCRAHDAFLILVVRTGVLDSPHEPLPEGLYMIASDVLYAKA